MISIANRQPGWHSAKQTLILSWSGTVRILAIVFVLCAGVAQAAVVERVIPAKNMAILKLSKNEKRQLSSGQGVTIDTGSDDTIVGTIESIKGAKALIKIDWGVDQLSAGSKVTFAEVKSKKPKRTTDEGDTASRNKYSGTPRMSLDLREMHETVYRTIESYGHFVSPVQQYQGGRHNLQLDLGFTQVDREAKTGSNKTTVKGDITGYGVTGMFSIKRFAFKLGLMIKELRANLKQKSGNTSVRAKTDLSIKGPIIVYPIDQDTIIGAFFGLYEITEKFGTADKQSESFNRLDIGVIKKWGEDEYGLLYQPSTEIDDSVQYATPATILAHYDVKIAPDMRLNGHLSHLQYQMVEDGAINGWELVSGLKFGQTPREFFGFHLHYHTRHFGHHPTKSTDDIARIGLSFDQKMQTSEDSYFSYIVKYEYAEDKIKQTNADDTNLKLNDITAGLNYRHDF